MAYRGYKKRGKTGTNIIGCVGCWYLWQEFGAIEYGTSINFISAIAAFVFFAAGSALLAEGLWYVGDYLDHIKVKIPIGNKGSASWVKSLRELGKDVTLTRWAPYWGKFKGRAVMADYASNALTIGPPGTGKGVGVIQPTTLSIHEDKIVIDFKGENTCVLADALRKRGETVRVLNLGDQLSEIIGPSDEYNPLCLIADNFQRPGGLLDISDDVEEMSLQLYAEPNSGGGDDKYFRDGSRNKIGFAANTCVLIDGPQATLGDMAKLLSDRESLLKHALWACGKLPQKSEHDTEEETYSIMPIEDSPWAELHTPEDVTAFCTYYRSMADGIASLLKQSESKTADSFLTGAQQALSRYNVATRAHKHTQRSSFRFSELKEGDNATTVFIIADPSRINAQKGPLALIQWCAFQELKRHPNKHRSVYVLADEAANFVIHDLQSLLTWGRAFGIRLHIVLQSFSAFRSAYSKETLETLLGQTEIKQFLPGQSEPEALDIIEKMLAEQSIISKSNSGNTDAPGSGLSGFGYNEEAKPLMSRDEIRRTDKTILIIRRNNPMLVDLPPIAAIWPFRNQIGINPYHGKKFLRRVVLRLRRRSGFKGRWVRMITRCWSTLWQNEKGV